MRIQFGYACTGAAPTSVSNFNYAQVAQQDANDYGTTGIRYQNIRIEKVEAWVNVSRSTVTSATGNGGPSRVTVTDTASAISQFYADTPNPGVDWAVIGYKPDLQQRQSWVGTGSTAIFSIITIESSGLTATDSFGGMIVIDFTVALR